MFSIVGALVSYTHYINTVLTGSACVQRAVRVTGSRRLRAIGDRLRVERMCVDLVRCFRQENFALAPHFGLFIDNNNYKLYFRQRATTHDFTRCARVEREFFLRRFNRLLSRMNLLDIGRGL